MLMEKIIGPFKGEFAFLSNFYYFDGRTVEHEFQAAKTLSQVDRLRIRDAKSPGEAKRLGRNVELRSGWEHMKVGVMEELLWIKFSTNVDLAVKLLFTGNAKLVEFNWWGDKFWGVCDKTGKGRNELGKALMRVRTKLGVWVYNRKYDRIWNAYELAEI